MKLIKQQFPVDDSDEESKDDTIKQNLEADLVAIDIGNNFPKRQS